jgi:glycosyltransferase involved in cell wall biosynthesis
VSIGHRGQGPAFPRRPLTGLITVFHAVKLGGIAANMIMFPVLRADPDAPGRPATSVLVPARDEAHRLPAALAALRAQEAAEILVLDDESADDTASVVERAAAADQRVRLLRGTPVPAGWTGKNWACQQLADAARGELLVFCDADVSLAPGALDAIWSGMRRQRADVFSVFPRQRTVTPGERLLVPLIDEVLLAFLPHVLLRLPVTGAATANGQLLAFRRAAYRTLGGHASVAGKLVEDVAMARRVRAVGWPLGLALGGDLVSARMYRGYRESVRGFGKSLREAHGGSDVALAGALGWHILAYTVPWMLARHNWTWRVIGALGLAQRLLVNLKTGRRAPAEAALVPVTPLAALPAYVLAFRRAATWKSRRYPHLGGLR